MAGFEVIIYGRFWVITEAFLGLRIPTISEVLTRIGRIRYPVPSISLFDEQIHPRQNALQSSETARLLLICVGGKCRNDD